MPRNTESWFVARALALLPPKIVLSYADTAAGHMGYIYRASNFHYAGWTDMERKTPRFDYIAPGKHSRDAFRNGFTARVRRKPKVKYWTVTGNRRERKRLEAQCLWPKLDWKTNPPPTEHRSASRLNAFGRSWTGKPIRRRLNTGAPRGSMPLAEAGLENQSAAD